MVFKWLDKHPVRVISERFLKTFDSGTEYPRRLVWDLCVSATRWTPRRAVSCWKWRTLCFLAFVVIPKYHPRPSRSWGARFSWFQFSRWSGPLEWAFLFAAWTSASFAFQLVFGLFPSFHIGLSAQSDTVSYSASLMRHEDPSSEGSLIVESTSCFMSPATGWVNTLNMTTFGLAPMNNFA